MEEERIILMRRWSLFTGGLIALFWLIWYFFAGSVPVIRIVRMTSNWTLNLPFGISRWWDVLIGPIWSVAIISLLSTCSGAERRIENIPEDIFVGLAFGLIAGLMLGWLLGSIFGLVCSFYSTLAVGLLLASIIIGEHGLFACLRFILGLSLGSGLITGLAFSLIAGLAFSLIVSLALVSTISLLFILKEMIFTKFWTIISNWLIAKK